MPQVIPGFDRLAIGISLYTPQIPLKDAASQVQLIVVCSWMGAAPKHIAKYTAQYQTLYPNARILLIQSEATDTLLRSSAYHATRYTPAREVIKQTLSETGDSLKTPTHQRHIILHIFSNGGGIAAFQLMEQLKGETGSTMPACAMFLDSTPGRNNMFRSIRALRQAIPNGSLLLRVGFNIFIYSGLVVFLLALRLLQKTNVIETLRFKLTDEDIFPKDVPRAYFYSESDDMVGWRDVNDHALEAMARDYKTTNVRFEKSKHVAHAAVYKDKYWSLVGEVASGRKDKAIASNIGQDAIVYAI